MSIKITVDIQVNNTEEAILEMEHISQLIEQGYKDGQGWKIEGTDEKSKDLEGEFVEDENDHCDDDDDLSNLI